MIAKLKGLIDTIGEDYCIIDVNGVGYLVFASAKTLGKLVLRRPAALLIETVVREDSISLFGFADALEKAGFAAPVRVARGQDILAACGQLKSQKEKS